jgi:hypothetical protein
MRLWIAAIVLVGTANANVGKRDRMGWSMVDTQAGGAVVIPRYSTVPVFTGAGNGTINHPAVPALLYDWTGGMVKVPLETWTLVATSATNFTVTGSVSGAQAALTAGTPYTTPSGINFTITAGGTPFAANDQFVFSIVDKIDATTVPGATSFTIPNQSFQLSNIGFQLFAYQNGTILLLRDKGYLTLTTVTNTTLYQDTNPTLPANEALPSRAISHSRERANLMPFWDDLLAKPSSKVWVAIQGRAGTRNVIVEWVDWAHKDDPTASYTFEVVLFENAQRVRFHYLNMVNGTKSSANGSTATIGIQDSLTNDYASNQYSFNSAGVSNGLTIEYGFDNDADRLPDGIEAQYGTNPNTSFTDAGSPNISDGAQIAAGLNPTNPADNASQSTDSDGDTLLDVEETFWGLNPNNVDSDGDGLHDDQEFNGITDPLRADTDGDGLKDGVEDANHNGIVDVGETNPTLWDSDGDGVSDGDEVAQGTNPTSNLSSRMSAEMVLSANESRFIHSAIDSKGFMHVAWYERNQNGDNLPNDLYVALIGPDPTPSPSPSPTPTKVLVAATQITAHTGFDDRTPAILTLPGSGTVDRTILLNYSRRGEAFLTEIDFNQAPHNGSASTSATLVTRSRQITLPLAVQHPAIKAAADGTLHVSFMGSLPSNSVNARGLSRRKVDRGIYYMKLSATGDVMVPPTELYLKSAPAHGHMFPRIDLDKDGNVHGVFRAGDCRWSFGSYGCSIYYFKLSAAGDVLVPATRLQLDGNGGIEKGPQIAVGANGNVNIVYATTAPQRGNSQGAYAYGRGILLHVLSSVNNQITTVLNQKVLVDPVPAPPTANASGAVVAVYHSPAVALDAGSNLHVYSSDDRSGGGPTGYYFVFDPGGARKLGPFAVNGVRATNDEPSIGVSQNRAFIGYHLNAARAAAVRTFDFSGLGLDQSGNAQLAPPVPGMLTLNAVTPGVGPIGGSVLVAFTGSNFLSTTVPKIGTATLTNVLLYDSAHLVGTLDTTPLAPGLYDATVTNPNGDTATLTGAFYVGTPPDLATPNDLSVAPPPPDLSVPAMPDLTPPPKMGPTNSGGCGCHVGAQSEVPVWSLLLCLTLAVALRRRWRH